ncbi:MAG TPA: hypothetical protein VNK04_11390 [Gemmataceae bacterium]|nr:hypothetical protein [Gemmataceae bacterium]
MFPGQCVEQGRHRFQAELAERLGRFLLDLRVMAPEEVLHEGQGRPHRRADLPPHVLNLGAGIFVRIVARGDEHGQNLLQRPVDPPQRRGDPGIQPLGGAATAAQEQEFMGRAEVQAG